MFNITALLVCLLIIVVSTGRLVLCFPLGTPYLRSQCVPFRSSTCNSLGFSGYDHTPFPHPFSPNYVYSIDVLERVANKIIERTISSGCSPQAAKFLCFAYFPLCSTDKPGIRPIVPCKSLCERVREDCSSENDVTWLPWDCDLIGNYSVGSLCVGINDTSTTNTAVTTGIVSAPNGSKSGQLECTTCGIELLAPNSTFWSQTCATASKVTVMSRLASNGTVTYNVTVDEVYVPKPCANNSQGQTFAMLFSATVRSPSCTCPDMEVGASYLVSNYQVLDSSRNNTVPAWSLTTEGTVALWSDSYDELLTSGIGRDSGSSQSCL